MAAVTYMNANDVTGLVFDDSVDTLELFTMIQEIFLYYRNLHNEFRTMLLTQSSAHRIISCCAKFFDNFTMLLDSEFNLLESGDTFNSSTDPSSQLDRQAATITMAALVNELKKKGFNEPPIGALATSHIHDYYGLEYIQSCFYDGNKCIAMLIIGNVKSPLYPHSLPLLQYISNLLQPCILGRYSTFVSVHSYIRAAITSYIDSRDVNQNNLTRNLARIGWGINDDYQLALIGMRPDSVGKAGTIIGYYTYENLFPDCIAAKTDNNIIIIIHNSSDKIINSSLNNLVDKMYSMHMECGISLPCNGFLQIKEQYSLAEAALRLGSPNENVRLYRDIMSTHIVNTLLSGVSIKALCHLSAIKIYEYDIQNGSELLLTLESYLIHNKSLQAAAEKLFIHRNTMAYRINRIMKIADTDLDNPIERLHILNSCIALRNMNNNGVLR